MMEDGCIYYIGDHTPLPLKRVISGGQTGVDRAALDAAMELDIPVSGWCPRDRKALDGVIPAKYPLTETRGKSYQTRTKWNVRDSDATLILCLGEPTGGTALTIKYCEQLGKPFYVHCLNSEWGTYVDGDDFGGIIYWLSCHHVSVLNVAGSREGKYFPIYAQARSFLTGVLSQLQGDNDHVYEPVLPYLFTASLMPSPAVQAAS